MVFRGVYGKTFSRISFGRIMSNSKEDKPVGAARGTWGSVLAAPRLLPAPRLGQASTNTSVLRAPQLKAGSNPFVRVPSVSADTESNNTFGATTLTSEEKNNATWMENSKEEKKSEETTVPKFLPLHSSRESISFAGGTVPETTPEGLTRTSSFVFGQNLQDRVVKQNNFGEGSHNNKGEHPATNGSSELLFSSAVQASTDTQHPKPKDESGTSSASSIWGRVPETPPLPPVPPPGNILTGEEGETNVFQVNCRLFAFEGGQWKERCRGQLRLNDTDVGSRLVCRAAGSLRVLLNTKVWGEMTVERAGSKSLRVTATNSEQQVKVFLVMASPDEIGQLHKSLSARVAQAKQREETCTEAEGIDSRKATTTSDPKPAETCPTDTKDDTKSSNKTETFASQEQTTIQSAGNPVVVVSAEDDDQSQTAVLKRPLDDEEHHKQSKKVCTDSTCDVPEL